MKQLSVLKLFKGYIGEKSDSIRKDALRYGLLIPESATDEVCNQAIELYGKDGKTWNETFHKSWGKVANASIEQLVYEQIIHYMTTYGFEELGIFSHESVYLPHERLSIPDLKEDVELISIHAYRKEEVAEKLMTLLKSGIALSADTIACIIDLAELIDLKRFEEIKNREVRVALCDALQIVPKDPDEFLRYVIYKASGRTLKIQDPETIFSLKNHSRKELLDLFRRYLNEDEEASLKALASIFYRNKRLFLAMKTAEEKPANSLEAVLNRIKNTVEEKAQIREMNHLVNKIRKLATKYHRPIPLNRLDRLTSPATQISDEELKDAMDHITPFREIRILNGLSYALRNEEAIVYRIRNGKSFATTRKQLEGTDRKTIEDRYQMIRNHLIERLRPSLSGKKICLNEGFLYKAPTSEKQFVGDFPCGSSFEMECSFDLIFGIHWTNIDPKTAAQEGRVDLDLHMQNLNTSYGWNSAYRNVEDRVIFSGDMTDAPLPDGASELFYIGKDVDSSFMFTINNYTYNGEKIPFEVVFAKGKAGITQEELEEDHMVDPNDILLQIPMNMPAFDNMMRLGFVYVFDDRVKVVFDSFSSGKMIVSDNEDPVFRNTFQYLTAYQKTALSLKELLEECGASIIEVPIDEEGPSEREADFDLRLRSLNKETIIKLFSEE